MTAKRQRLILAILALVAIGGAAVLALSALQDTAAYFYSPADVAREGVPVGRAVRLGGMVKAGSLRREPDGVTYRFAVADGAFVTPVRFKGVPPDLFREGSGVVAEGRFGGDGTFMADNLLAKHDERYMPPQLEDGRHKTETLEP